MKVIGLASTLSVDNLSHADLVISTFKELNVGKVERLIQNNLHQNL